MNEIAVAENKIKGLSDKIILQDHELVKLREQKLDIEKFEKLKNIEGEANKKDKYIADLK